jgi:HSP20 family protein
MIQSIRQIGKEISRTWENLTEGWRELLARSSNALTHFSRRNNEKPEAESPAPGYPNWSLLAGEVVDTGGDIVARIELPGIDKDDCEIAIDGNILQIRGEKRAEREFIGGAYYVMERAYGSFERIVPLPRYVDPTKAEASFHNGVLTVRVPKLP